MSTTSLGRALLCLVVIQSSITVLITGQTYDGYACINDNIVLQCPDNKNISITVAYYGQYEPVCPNPNGCCPPQEDTDCRKDVEEVEADDMADLRDACDGQNSCNSYRVLGGPLSECDGLRQAQYMQVYHKCLPEDPTTVAPTTEELTSSASTTSSTTTSRRPPIPPTTTQPEDEGLSGGVIAAIVIGVILLIAIIVLVVVIVWRKLHPPPKPKKVVRRRVGKKTTTVYDNQAFASSDQVVIHVDQESKTIPNGVHNNNKDTGPPPMSDGKRKTKPVTAAESFRYAQEKDSLANKYKTDAKSDQRKAKNNKKASKGLSSQQGDYYSMNGVQKVQANQSEENMYENQS